MGAHIWETPILRYADKRKFNRYYICMYVFVHIRAPIFVENKCSIYPLRVA